MTGSQSYQKLWTAFSSQRHLAPQELSVHIIAFSVAPESSHYGEIHDKYSRASNTYDAHSYDTWCVYGTNEWPDAVSYASDNSPVIMPILLVCL